MSEARVAWDMGKEPFEIRLARVGRPTSRGRRIAPNRKGAGPAGSAYSNPVLDGRFLYFVERVTDDSFIIARTSALKRRGIRRYEVSFTERPSFAVEHGGLLYSGNTRSRRPNRSDVITRDYEPVFK